MGYVDNVWPPPSEDDAPTRDNAFPPVNAGPTPPTRPSPTVPVQDGNSYGKRMRPEYVQPPLTKGQMRVGYVLAGIVILIALMIVVTILAIVWEALL